MTTQFITWLEEQRGERSIRALARDLGLSHAYVAEILNGKRPLTWGFCATVAERVGVSPVSAFQMAGLLPVEGEGLVRVGEQGGKCPTTSSH